MMPSSGKYIADMKVKDITCCFHCRETFHHIVLKKKKKKPSVEIVYLPGCLVSLRCGSVSLGRQAHPRSCQCQLGWEAGRPSLLPQSEGSTEAVTSCTRAERTQSYIHVQKYINWHIKQQGSIRRKIRWGFSRSWDPASNSLYWLWERQ